VGADLSAHDLGKKERWRFLVQATRPLMAIGYAIGVGTFPAEHSSFFKRKAV